VETEVTSAALQRLLGINKSVLNDLAKRGIVLRGKKRGSCAGGRAVHSIKSGHCATASRRKWGATSRPKEPHAHSPLKKNVYRQHRPKADIAR
jgi:hypothetical protein